MEESETKFCSIKIVIKVTTIILHLSLPHSLLPILPSQIPIKRKHMAEIHPAGHPLLPSNADPTNVTIYEIQCEKHILTSFIIPDILLFLSFVYGLYIFRWVQTEQLSTLTETVSLSFSANSGPQTQWSPLWCGSEVVLV